jgi:hypothetical protein
MVGKINTIRREEEALLDESKKVEECRLLGCGAM